MVIVRIYNFNILNKFMRNKILIIITVAVLISLGIVYWQKNNVSADTSTVNDCYNPSYACYYESWPQASNRKANDPLFDTLSALSRRERGAGGGNDNTIVDYNGDGLSDIIYNRYNCSSSDSYCSTGGSERPSSLDETILMVLYLNNNKGGYDEYYKCVAHFLNGSWKYYGNCADI